MSRPLSDHTTYTLLAAAIERIDGVHALCDVAIEHPEYYERGGVKELAENIIYELEGEES